MFSLKSKRGSHAFPESGATRITCFACPVCTNLCLSLFCRVFSSLPVSTSSHSVCLFEHSVPTLLSSWKNTSHWAYPYLMGPHYSLTLIFKDPLSKYHAPELRLVHISLKEVTSPHIKVDVLSGD